MMEPESGTKDCINVLDVAYMGPLLVYINTVSVRERMWWGGNSQERTISLA